MFFLLILPVTGIIPDKVAVPSEEPLPSEEPSVSKGNEQIRVIPDERKESISSEEPSVSDSIEYASDHLDEKMFFFILPEEVSVKVNETFSIHIGVENVTDMFGWQVCLHFDPQILECTDIYVPSDEVFSYGVTAGEALVEYNATEFTNPIYRIWDDEGEILVGNCLLGENQPNFNGSGILFQADFRAISTGLHAIELGEYGRDRSFILGSEGKLTPLPQSVYLPVIVED